VIRSRISFGGSSLVREFQRSSIQRLERAALIATDRAATIAKNEIRSAMSGGGLGRLGFALGSTSDLQKGRLLRRGPEGFSASGVVFVRSRSERTMGAIEAYTEGAEIGPRRGRWLWIATPDIPARSQRYRMTPARYVKNGLEQSIGPLVFIPGRHPGEALLVVRNVTVSTAGRRGSARRLPKRGGIRPGRDVKDFIVAFVGIRRTSRAARVNVRAIIAQVQQRLPELISAAMR
jgi:hypothetical protein